MARCSIWPCAKRSTVWLTAWSRANGRRRSSEPQAQNSVSAIGRRTDDGLPVARGLLLGPLRKSGLYHLCETRQGNGGIAGAGDAGGRAKGGSREQAAAPRVSRASRLSLLSD